MGKEVVSRSGCVSVFVFELIGNPRTLQGLLTKGKIFDSISSESDFLAGSGMRRGSEGGT